MAGSTAASRISPAATQYDLVICYDVLQYLNAAETRRALANLARVSRGLLYFGVLTREDWEENCDQSRTDPAVSLRGGAWYRRELSKQFRHLGAGFWLRRDCPGHGVGNGYRGPRMSTPPRHTSLETQFAAAVPPQRAPLAAARCCGGCRCAHCALRPVQRIIEKKYRA